MFGKVTMDVHIEYCGGYSIVYIFPIELTIDMGVLEIWLHRYLISGKREGK
jgi:hypothetical protein